MVPAVGDTLDCSTLQDVVVVVAAAAAAAVVVAAATAVGVAEEPSVVLPRTFVPEATVLGLAGILGIAAAAASPPLGIPSWVPCEDLGNVPVEARSPLVRDTVAAGNPHPHPRMASFAVAADILLQPNTVGPPLAEAASLKRTKWVGAVAALVVHFPPHRFHLQVPAAAAAAAVPVAAVVPAVVVAVLLPLQSFQSPLIRPVPRDRRQRDR